MNERIQDGLAELENSGSSRLTVVFSTSDVSFITVSEAFRVCELVATESTLVHLSVASTYCGVQLSGWFARGSHPNHELVWRTRVVVETPDYSGDESPPPFTPSSDADQVASSIRTAMDTSSPPREKFDTDQKKTRAFPWLAGFAGLSGLSATCLVTAKLEFSVKGVYVTCQVASTAGVGGATLVAAGLIGVGFAAAVYFFPWRKLFRWMMNCWNRFVEFMRSVWQFLKNFSSRFINFIQGLLKWGASVAGAFTGAFTGAFCHALAGGPSVHAHMA